MLWNAYSSRGLELLVGVSFGWTPTSCIRLLPWGLLTLWRTIMYFSMKSYAWLTRGNLSRLAG